MRNSATHQYMENLDFSWTDESIRFINTASPKSRQTFFYVQEAGDFCTFPPYFTERENLNSFLLIYTLSGKGLLKYQGKTWQLLPGTLAYIDCMDHHYYECLKNQQWKFLWLHFNGPSALGYYEEFLKSNFHILNSLDPFFYGKHSSKNSIYNAKKGSPFRNPYFRSDHGDPYKNFN